MLKARRRAFPVKVCGGYKGSPSLPLKGDELLKTALPLPPPSSLALSTALLIQWGGVVRCVSHTLRTNGKGAWPQSSSAGEGHRGARQLPRQQDALQVKVLGQGRVDDEFHQSPRPQIHLGAGIHTGAEFSLSLSDMKALDTCSSNISFVLQKGPCRFIFVERHHSMTKR